MTWESLVFAQKDFPEVKVKPDGKSSSRGPVKPLLGSLAIFSAPEGAQVFVNGKFRETITAEGGLSKPPSLKPGKYRLRVTHPDFEPFEQAVVIRPGEPAQVRAALVPKFGFVRLTIADAKPGTTVKVDGKDYPETDRIRESNNTLLLKVPIGTSVVTVEAAGFRAASQTVAVVDRTPVAVPIVLEPITGTVRVRTLPGSRVYVGGHENGTVPESGALVVGPFEAGREVALRVERDGREPFESGVLVEADKETVLEVRLTPKPTSAEFADTFDTLQFWDAPPGWKAENNLLHVSGSAGAGFPKEKYFCDSEVVFGLKLADERGAAWMLWSDDKKDCLLFYLNGPSGPAPNKFQTFLCRGGKPAFDQPVSPALPVVPPLEPGASCRIRIRVKGNVVEHFLTPSRTGEEISLGVYKGPSGLAPCGNVGFASLKGEDFFVHGFVVTPK